MENRIKHHFNQINEDPLPDLKDLVVFPPPQKEFFLVNYLIPMDHPRFKEILVALRQLSALVFKP